MGLGGVLQHVLFYLIKFCDPEEPEAAQSRK